MDPVTARNREIVDTLREITRGEANKAIEWMDDWTNDLAGKTNPFDRGIQKETGRRIMKGVEWLNGRVKSNAVLGNFASAAAQFFNAPNGIGYIKNPVDMAAGAKDWVKSVMPVHTDIDDLLEQSGFLGERYLDKGLNRLEKSDQLLKNILHSPQQFAEWMLNVGDEQTTKWIWLSAYNQAERKGIADAVAYADDIARRSVGGRGIGEIPLMQKSRIVQLLAPFQLEVNNAYQSVKEHLTAGDYLAVLEIAASGFLMNEVSEQLLGRRIAWDPIGAFRDAEESIPEDTKNNIHPLDRIAFHGLRQFGEAVSNMPFGNYISAFLIPDQYRQTLLGDTDPTRYGTGGDLGISTLVKPFAAAAANSVDRVMGVADEEKMNIRNPDWQNAALQFLMPFGGKQLDRTLKAAQDMSFIPRMPWDKAGEFAPDMPAAYNNTGRFKFSIDTQDKANISKGLLFGTNTTKEGIQYAKSGSYPLNGGDSWAIQKAYTHGVMPDRFLELSGIIQNMKPDRDGDRVIATKKAKQEQFIMDSPDLDADQKRWLMGYFLPEDTMHRDYSSPHAFIISGLQDSKQELWQYDSVKKAVGNNAVSYKTVLDTVSNLNYHAGQQGGSPSRQEKIQAIASALNLPLYQSENIYAEIYEYKHALKDFSEEQQAKIANGSAASGFTDQDIIDMMNTLNHVKANQRVEALTNAGYSQEDASRFVDTMFYCKYTRDDLSEKENEILDSLKTKYNMSEDAFFTAYNLVNGIPGVKNANGKTISGSQKKARFKALASAPGWNQEGARNFLMELYGYTDKSWF